MLKVDTTHKIQDSQDCSLRLCQLKFYLHPNDKSTKMSDSPAENQENNESLQSFQSMNLNDPGETHQENENNQKCDKQKIDILLKPTGNAPIMKKKKWTVEGDKPISWIAEFMKRYMRLEPQEKLFLYVNQTFAPSPDQIMKNLYDCYSTEGKLVLHYCKTPAWG